MTHPRPLPPPMPTPPAARASVPQGLFAPLQTMQVFLPDHLPLRNRDLSDPTGYANNSPLVAALGG